MPFSLKWLVVAAAACQLASFPLALRTRTTETCTCTFPAGVLGSIPEGHSLITQGDADVVSQNIYRRMTIGGDLLDSHKGLWKVADGMVTVGGTGPERSGDYWNFNYKPDSLAYRTGVPFSSVFRWSDFETLAQSIHPGEYAGDYKVIVMTSGGTFNHDDFRDVFSQAEDNGKTLVVFKTHEDVTLDLVPSSMTHPNGKQFGPSVLAPFSAVNILMRTNFIDGFLIAKSLVANTSQMHCQMHGDGYTGPMECDCGSAVGDPHVWNLAGEKFDVNQPGEYVLLRVPLVPGEKVLLELRGDVQPADDAACAMYFKSVSFAGEWVGGKMVSVRSLKGQSHQNTWPNGWPFALKVSAPHPAADSPWRTFEDLPSMMSSEDLPDTIKVTAVFRKELAAVGKVMEAQAFEFRLRTDASSSSYASILVAQGSHEGLDLFLSEMKNLNASEIGGLLGTTNHDRAVEVHTTLCTKVSSMARLGREGSRCSASWS